MFNYNLPADQDRLQFQIGIEKPISEMSLNFFIPGRAILHLPRISIGPFCEQMTPPAVFSRGDQVPLTYCWEGQVHFGSAKWEAQERSTGEPVYLRQAEMRSLGFPAMIPASFIDLTCSSRVVRLRPIRPEYNLYVGCRFENHRSGEARTVTPLVCEAGPDLAPHVDWQPLLIPVSAYPHEGNFDFVLRRDAGRLQRPSIARTSKIDIVE